MILTGAQWLIVLNWLIGFGIPILVNLVTDSGLAKSLKALLALALAGVSTLLTSLVAALTAHLAFDWFAAAFTFVTTWIVAAASYGHLWKPTGVAAKTLVMGVGGKGRHEA